MVDAGTVCAVRAGGSFWKPPPPTSNKILPFALSACILTLVNNIVATSLIGYKAWCVSVLFNAYSYMSDVNMAIGSIASN